MSEVSIRDVENVERHCLECPECGEYIENEGSVSVGSEVYCPECEVSITITE